MLFARVWLMMVVVVVVVAQVHDFLLTHFAYTKASAEKQQALWATCRFSYLPPEQLVDLAERPHVPPKWLALACAQNAAGGGGGGGSSGVVGPEAARLRPRDHYRR